MKLLLAILMLFSVEAVTAQYGGMHGGGRSRLPEPAGKRERKKVDHVEQGIKKLTADLDLDAFQQAVITELMERTQEEQKKIYASNAPADFKMQRMTTLGGSFEGELKQILNPDQILKYEAAKEEKGKKKNKKKKY